MSSYGISEVVISPGSRNAPLIAAIDNLGQLSTTVVIDERTAGFLALGKAMITRKCVALVCTSGTAMFNYSPAIAEAKYRNIPLLVITADRAHEWIDRNDGQTLWQSDAFSNLCGKTFNISHTDTGRFVSLTVNEAINEAVGYPPRPVHLNVEIDNPSLESFPSMTSFQSHVIKKIQPDNKLKQSFAKELSERLKSPTRVMIVAGIHEPSQKLNRALKRLCGFGNYIVLADMVSNLHGTDIISSVDTVLSHYDFDNDDSLKPDIIISFGGAILSSNLKKLLRSCKIEHWHIGSSDHFFDTYESIHYAIQTDAESFFTQLVSVSRPSGIKSDFNAKWSDIAQRAIINAREWIRISPWSDLKAITTLLSLTPRNYNIQLSNGMAVRYAQALPYDFHRTDCNRGVSGIDGSTSTAIGAATAYSGNTLLISGDMSATYDISCLINTSVPPHMKIAIIHNGGGGIFNYIKGTRQYDSVDRFMTVESQFTKTDIGVIAKAIGLKVFEANNETELRNNYKAMLSTNDVPCILIIHTDKHESAATMINFINRNK